MKHFLILLTLVLAGCAQAPTPPTNWTKLDKPVAFGEYETITHISGSTETKTLYNHVEVDPSAPNFNKIMALKLNERANTVKQSWLEVYCSPGKMTERMNSGWSVYHYYFVKKQPDEPIAEFSISKSDCPS